MRRVHPATENGHVSHRRRVIGSGRRREHAKVVVADHGELVEVYCADERVRAMRLDPAARYLGAAREAEPPPAPGCRVSTTS